MKSPLWISEARGRGVQPSDYQGKTIKLGKLPTPNETAIKWKVMGYGSGLLKLQTIGSNQPKNVVEEWREFLRMVQAGDLEVE